ncbi:Aldo-ket-red domain-containing protein [Fusarium falciforme]|uniref:Aldo-ket-red domain-containing protein n=1 Tax=Fusarium falciforme TaxID=195108 RepID=UPI0023001F19|nr:Aldo-ket-red domain-containing protein [Fusarium falciforme]WAO95786.1 Aldo-ket-red domain-containing protein [Fusarium falciforme]
MAPPTVPAPKSLLGRHRLLAPTAGVFVSPICLGTMNFGSVMNDSLGECTKETAFEILDYFYEQGGNFLDTASSYQGEESEKWLGEWLSKTGRRDEFVLATKYTGNFKSRSESYRQQSNFGGNGTKSLHLSVEASLKKLQTTYIDLLYLHFWDMTADIPEIMQSLNHLVSSGKVLYLGISDTPAWIVVKCNEYARQHGLRQFSVYQGRWSAADRDFERDIIPMCRAEGMGLAPWGTLGRGLFKPKDQIKVGGRNMPSMNNGRESLVSEKLEQIANAKGVPITSVALAYVLHKSPYVFPILGGRKLDHIRGNIEALGLRLTSQEMEDIETAYPFDVGFPHNFLSGNTNRGSRGPGDIRTANVRGLFDYVEDIHPILPPLED